MFSYLQIYDPRERIIVAAADAASRVVAPIARLVAGRRSPRVERILLLRLERIGDLLMVRDAIAEVRRRAPDAAIDLVVGRWNEPLARMLPEVTRVETLSALWLARGAAADSPAAMVRRALRWRRVGYDLAINFEPDIRSNVLIALSGAPRRVGYRSGGGGPWLTDAVAFDPTRHTRENALRLVRHAFDSRADRDVQDPVAAPDESARLQPPADARTRAASMLPAGSRLIGVHVSGGRAIKQWPPERFAAVAAALAHDHDATIVLTGAAADRPLVDAGAASLPPAGSVIDLCGDHDLATLAAVLERLDVLITGDTGPMHLAAAVGTPVVAVFGPSDPRRYAAVGAPSRVVRVDLACAPCNRIRLPPERCRGGVPDCLAGVTVDAVLEAARDLLAAR